MGVTECDNMLMLLAVSTKMTEKERDVVVPLMMRGFKVNIFCLYLGSTQGLLNRWTSQLDLGCTTGGLERVVSLHNST